MQSSAELFTALKSVDWFSKCGEPMNADYLHVKSPEDAKECYSGKAGWRWENFKNSIMNRRRSLLWEATQHCRQEQQQRAKETQQLLQRFLLENNREIYSVLKENPELKRMIALDLGCITSELEYVAHENINFFSKVLLPIYLSGHLPCGWRGKPMAQKWNGNSLADLPEGKVIVF